MKWGKKNLKLVVVGDGPKRGELQKQAKELNYHTQWIGVGGQFTEAYFKMTGPISEYAMGSSLEPTKAMKDPVTAAFVNAYLKKYPGSRPGIFSSQGFDNLRGTTSDNHLFQRQRQNYGIW